MSRLGPPRVLLFDIGGVCVASPFQAILDYERAHDIPLGYINYSISKTSPNGIWHKLERGEVKLDAGYFASFKADLENEERWHEYHERLSRGGEAPEQGTIASSPPPVPNIDAEKLFWSMMSNSGRPDPCMLPALQKIKAANKFTVAALSNTVIFPPNDSPRGQFSGDDARLRDIFDVFVSSAHVGMRKPESRIYQHTMHRLREKEGSDLTPDQVLFLDDIGENLKAARALGMRTIRVRLGRTDLAVEELQASIGMQLLPLDDRLVNAKL